MPARWRPAWPTLTIAEPEPAALRLRRSHCRGGRSGSGKPTRRCSRRPTTTCLKHAVPRRLLLFSPPPLLRAALLLLLAAVRIHSSLPATAAFSASGGGGIGLRLGGGGGGADDPAGECGEVPLDIGGGGGSSSSSLPPPPLPPPTTPDHRNPAPLPSYSTRSTATPDESSDFHHGSELRRQRLDEALSELGIDPQQTFAGTNSELAGCASALRMYSSFILPKSEGALATAELPQRASVIARGIAFQLREYASHREEWLRNHDRSLEEADETFRLRLSRSRRRRRRRAADSMVEEGGLESESLSEEKEEKETKNKEEEGAQLQPLLRHPLTIILDNVRSAHNVGNILRLAEAARVANVALCGITPAPPHPKVLKTALGSAEFVPHQVVRGSTLDAVRDLKRRGVKVWGVETTSRSRVIWKTTVPRPPQHLALVFGNELVGVHADVLRECDEIVCLPTHGVKNSLNVATCVSVVVWEALRQWDEDDDEIS